MQKIECLIVGAGLIGLAMAKELAKRGYSVIVIEQEPFIGNHTSSRNSEVIHAGIYYPPNSLKAYHCVKGKELIYQYCKNFHVPYQKIGKLIIATNKKENDILYQLKQNAIKNGVDDLKLLSHSEISSIQPELNVTAALWSPSSGIVDTHALLLGFHGELEKYGGFIAFNTKVFSIEAGQNGILVHTIEGEKNFSIECDFLINSAGLWATEVALKISNFPQEYIYDTRFAKGHYCSLAANHNFKHLIYPVPVKDGLGVHLTLDLGGKAKFGPDIYWCESIDYSMNDIDRLAFIQAIKRYWPSMSGDKLQVDYSGIRPKAFYKNKPVNDFVISTPKEHGIPGLINLYGIESPGLTSCLSIADTISQIF